VDYGTLSGVGIEAFSMGSLYQHQGFLRKKMLGTWNGPVGTRFL